MNKKFSIFNSTLREHLSTLKTQYTRGETAIIASTNLGTMYLTKLMCIWNMVSQHFFVYFNYYIVIIM